MMKLLDINVEKITPNVSQPRAEFDKEKIKELAESILSNGLINPITVREYPKGHYQIVSGERRWRACKIASLKTIPAFVKEYKSDGQMAIESLIENVHREDLTTMEKAKFLKRIMSIENIKEIGVLARTIKINDQRIRAWFDELEFKKRHHDIKNVEHTYIRATAGLKDNDRKKLIKLAQKKGISARQLDEKIAPIVRNASENIRKAILNDDIDVEQAGRIQKLPEEKQQRAIKEHKDLKKKEEKIVHQIENEDKILDKKALQKRLVKVNALISDFGCWVTDSKQKIQEALKSLLTIAPYVNIMDEKQRERLDDHINRFLEVLERGEQLAEQIQEKLK